MTNKLRPIDSSGLPSYRGTCDFDELPPSSNIEGDLIIVADRDFAPYTWQTAGWTCTGVVPKFDPVTGGIAFQIGRLEVQTKVAAIGKRPMTMTGIGNSIMTASMPWWTVCCEKSSGMFRQYDSGHGVAGNKSSDILARVSEVPSGADLVVIQEDTNDAILGVSRADNIANKRSIIEFYIARGQVPVLCFPPPIGNSTYSATIRAFGMITYFLAQEYGIPCVDPWSQFVVEATGLADTSKFNLDDGSYIHPLASAHVAAGATMYSQLTAGGCPLPLPVATSPYGAYESYATYELIPHPLMDVVWDSGSAAGADASGTGASASIITDSAIPGSWQRITGSGTGQFTISQQKYQGYGVEAGDELFAVGRFRASAVSGVASIGLSSSPGNVVLGFNRMCEDACDGTFVSSGVVPSNVVFVQLAAFLLNGTGKTVDFAQVQVYNKTALFNR